MDYTPITVTTLTFLAGERLQEITVNTLQDDMNEDQERFTASLSNLVNVDPGENDEATVFIIDDDGKAYRLGCY